MAVNETRENKASSAADSSVRVRKLAFAGIFAAITFVVFSYLSIPIPTPGGGQVSVHLGNAFVVLGALLIGSLYGSLGGAIGLTIADLIVPAYLPEAPITFLIKFAMGLLVGLVAHKIGHITREDNDKKVFTWTMAAAAAGFIFNAIFDPVLRYFYKILILGKPLAEVSLKINITVTLINSVVSFVLVMILYMALRKPLQKMGLAFRF